MHNFEITISDIQKAMDIKIMLAAHSVAKERYCKRLEFNPYSLNYSVEVKIRGELTFNKTYKHPQDAVEAFNDN